MRKNMKIEINQDQPLDEVVSVLREIGKKYLVVARVFEGDGFVFVSQLDAFDRTYPVPVIETTLAELKEMK